MRIYITHCSKTKNDSLKNTGIEVTPNRLYTSDRIQRFMNKCKEAEVNWAIFSDKYGVWIPAIKHRWYDKPPCEVTPEEFIQLVNDFDRKLQDYDEIWFYHHPKYIHPLYLKLLQEVKLNDKVKRFHHISEII